MFVCEIDIVLSIKKKKTKKREENTHCSDVFSRSVEIRQVGAIQRTSDVCVCVSAK